MMLFHFVTDIKETKKEKKTSESYDYPLKNNIFVFYRVGTSKRVNWLPLRSWTSQE